MTGCAAPNCSGNTRKGMRLFKFPASPRRNNKWLQNCRRDKWTPTKASRLCEGHFDENQFETAIIGENGRRKLRRTAIPTIFDVPNMPHGPQRDRPASTFVSQQQIIETASDPAVLALVDHNYSHDLTSCSLATTTDMKVSSHMEVGECNKIPALPGVPKLVHCSHPQSPPDVLLDTPEKHVSAVDTSDDVCGSVSKNYEESIIVKQQRIIWRLQKNMTTLRKENQRLKQKMKQKIVHLSFLTKEQRETLCSGNRIKEWSPEAIINARRIRSVVGCQGYKHLTQKGFLLPSYSTLCRKADH